MENSFFALLFRQKYIKRWGLMRNTTDENLSEHSAETAFIAHALALIGNKKFGKSYDADAIAVAALYHDAAEIYTGDLPTPVKYYSEEMRKNYKQIEAAAEKILVSHLPEEFREVYSDIISGVSGEEKVLVKAADKICALIKCIEEGKSGNSEFASAEKATRISLDEMNSPEANYFIKEFLPAFLETIDENSL
ncbi:MAG: 5'-deoxynucleotidase [Ruminococcaceae bacterium]|nr:5'-deoxynucleotidase [Oscillospiraceae bacterium]